MSLADVVQLAYFLTVIALIVFLFRFGKTPRTYITDYMRGLRFVKGRFVDVLGPGGYKPLTRRVQVEVVDMRPVPFLMEQISFRDALQSDSMISIGAELAVDDPYLAGTSLKDRVRDSLPIVRQGMSSTVSRIIVDRTPEFRVRVAEDIQKTVNEELRRVGMKISDVEITEIFSRNTPSGRVSKGLN